MRDVLRSLWAEPRVPDPPPRSWRDWALVGVSIPAAILEGTLRPDLVWRPASLVVVVALMFTLLWRRSHPHRVVVVAFGSLAVLDVVAIVAGVEWEGLGAAVVLLLLPYSLFRWASGRETVTGLGIIMIPVSLAVFTPGPISDVLGGAAVVSLAALFGAVVRYRDNARLRGVDQVRLRERELLARELHDAVAHHVSAIAVRAQAGRTLAQARPDAAVDALVVIEEEASRTLEEMRTMVGALREGEEPDLTPQRGVIDINRLVAEAGGGPSVEVELSGDLDLLRPSVDAALYRLAQESITNARRHARHATRIRVSIDGDDDTVRLTVRDDGDAVPPAAGSSPGFGLVGMTERAKLLGGTLEAGPGPAGGWTVAAVLPKGGAPL